MPRTLIRCNGSDPGSARNYWKSLPRTGLDSVDLYCCTWAQRPGSRGQPYIGVMRASSTSATTLEISVLRCERSVIVRAAMAADSFLVTTS